MNGGTLKLCAIMFPFFHGVSRRSELRYCAVAEKIWGFEL